MDLQKRLAQCQVDKRAIGVKEQELLDAIESENKKQIPFARTAQTSHGVSQARLILHITHDFVRLVNKHKGQVVALGNYGGGDEDTCCNTADNDMPNAGSLVYQYKNVQVLID